MKKTLILVAIMLAAATLFAETEKMTCESEAGTCVYELDGTVFHEYCTCEGGSYDKINNHSNSAAMPREWDCSQNIDANAYCKKGVFACDNDAGRCHVDQYGKYLCSCWGVYSANGAVEGAYTGTSEFVEESCKSKLVEICGTELATIGDVCEDQEILKECVTYIKPVETCYGRQWPDEDIETILDHQAYGSSMYSKISNCCQIDDDLRECKTKWECLENCTEEDCCKACGWSINEDESSEESVADAANTETQATDAAPAENKEESKSDGCSLLFI